MSNGSRSTANDSSSGNSLKDQGEGQDQDRSQGQPSSNQQGSSRTEFDLDDTVDQSFASNRPQDVDTADVLDQLLEECLEKLLAIAPIESPEQLKRIIPESDAATTRFLLCELIKMDMATAAEVNPSKLPTIEPYLQHFTDVMTSSDVPLDLLMEEIQLRKELGAAVDDRDYRQRFPQHDAMISELLGGNISSKPEATSAVANRHRPPEFDVGEQVDDFVIVQTLGSGAFANVYLARQVSMSRLVALKVSRGTGDEPQALAQFDHPNIVRVFDQRELQNPPAHLLYMQFHPGGTLADVVKRVRETSPDQRTGQVLLDAIDRSLLRTAQAVPERSSLRDYLGQLPWPMVVAWTGIELARALENAHHREVMHRDVKPANVLLAADGIPKLADFNVSFSGSAGRAGAASSFGGSIGYMSPEHLRAISATATSRVEEVGPRADLYSLGILLWELWQGTRPFECKGNPTSWTEAVTQQLSARQNLDALKCDSPDALSRLLEQILRQTMSFEADERVASGRQLAARLKLALHPDAARLFDPEPSSWLGWFSRRSPWLVAAVAILVPNAIAGVYGFIYNAQDTLGEMFEQVSGLKAFFQMLSTCVNLFAFPLAVFLVILFTKRVVQGLKRVERGVAPSDEDLFRSLELAHRSAVVGGILWCVAAILYPTVLSSQYEEFTRREFGHFFVSHVICGSVAAIYPYFGLSAYAISVLYPKMTRATLEDGAFDDRVKRVVRRSEFYLLLACLVPLLGATLLLVTEEDAKQVMLIAIAATGLGLIAAFSAYRFILRQFSVMAPVLSKKRDSYVPR